MTPNRCLFQNFAFSAVETKALQQFNALIYVTFSATCNQPTVLQSEA